MRRAAGPARVALLGDMLLQALVAVPGVTLRSSRRGWS